jgi:gas vesicle protein
MRTSSVILGIAAGAAVGALLGILLAPDRGANTRRKIADQGQRVVDHVKAGYHHLVNGEAEPQVVEATAKRKLREPVDG